jgi:hypothetical protein
MLSAITLSVIKMIDHIHYHDECHYAECRYAECRYNGCHGASLCDLTLKRSALKHHCRHCC